MNQRLDPLSEERMSRLTFQELREAMHMSNEGKVLDSFIAVEIGLDDFEACWDAHCDVYDDKASVLSDEERVSLFIHELYDMLEIDADYLGRVLAPNT